MIELLTVIAIIGILAAILIPTVGKVRDKARASQCTNNLRQWATAIHLFAADNRGAYQINTAASGSGTWWYQVGTGAAFYTPYFSTTRDYASLTRCPTETRTGSNSIGYTGFLFARPTYNGADIGYNKILINRFASPSQAVLMVERSFDSSGGFDSGNAYYLFINRNTALANAQAFDRHGGKMATVFADGHTAWLSAHDWAAQNSGSLANYERWLKMD